MKTKRDIVYGWVRKAESDLIALDAALEAGAFDAACFHAQQGAEKYLKAFLVLADRTFPFTHNLSKLVLLCAEVDASLSELLVVVEGLTPYAVEMRYDNDFWPTRDVVDAERPRCGAPHPG